MAVHTSIGFIVLGAGLFVVYWGKLLNRTMLIMTGVAALLPVFGSVAIYAAMIGYVLVILRRAIRARHAVEAERQEMLEMYERVNADLEQFVYVASHDLQEPLRKISAFGSILVELQKDCQHECKDQAVEVLGRMIGASERMRRLISDLLLYSRSRRFDLSQCEDISLRDLFSEVFADRSDFIKESDASVRMEGGASVKGVRTYLYRLFANLVSNAFKYCGEKPPYVNVHIQEDGNAVVVDVQDMGTGFDVSRKDEMFMPFKRLTKDGKGTGVGLAIAKEITRRHGGSIDATSTVGVGSTFSVTLPKGTQI
jgi:signal transduction histidine kinase